MWIPRLKDFGGLRAHAGRSLHCRDVPAIPDVQVRPPPAPCPVTVSLRLEKNSLLRRRRRVGIQSGLESTSPAKGSTGNGPKPLLPAHLSHPHPPPLPPRKHCCPHLDPPHHTL